MKDSDKLERFLELRAQGKSLRTIETETGINRRTLSKWESESKEELDNLKAIELDALREKYWLTRQARIRIYGDQYQRFIEELKKRDLSGVATPKLVDMALKLDTQLRDEALTPAIVDESGLEARKAVRNVVASLYREPGPMQSLKEGHEAKNGNGKVKGNDLVKLQVAILQRYEAGEIDGRTAAHEMGMVNSIFKGIEIADLQARLEQVEIALGAGQEA
jgi:transcriptional regulator with XRE-family HTH domain